MIKLLLIFFFLSIIPLKSQSVEISAVAYSVTSAHTIFYQMKDRQAYANGNPMYREYQKKWRFLLPLEAVSLICVGATIALNEKLSFKTVLTDLFVVGSIRWLVRDGVYQMLQGKDFFVLPNTEWTYFPGIEKMGSALFKLSLVTAVLVFKYFFLPML